MAAVCPKLWKFTRGNSAALRTGRNSRARKFEALIGPPAGRDHERVGLPVFGFLLRLPGGESGGELGGDPDVAPAGVRLRVVRNTRSVVAPVTNRFDQCARASLLAHPSAWY